MNRMVSRVVVLFTCAVLAIGAQSQSDPVNARGVPPEMERLASMAGDWIIRLETRAGPKRPWTTLETTSHIAPILSGAHLQESLSLPAGGDHPRIEMIALWSYDRFRKIYRQAYLDDSFALFDVHEGNFEGGKLILTNLRTNTPTVVGGRTLHSRLTVSRFEKDSFYIENETSSDGGKTWVLAIRGAYLRKK